MKRDGPVSGAWRPAAPAGEVPDPWQQQAGFSVFFDTRPGSPGQLRWRTRLYHEESADESTFLGNEPAGWVKWMLDRLGSAQPRLQPVGSMVSLVSMEIIDAQLIGDPKGIGDDFVTVELHLRVTGLDELHRALGAKIVGVLFGPEPG
jgi:hypothetical protein